MFLWTAFYKMRSRKMFATEQTGVMFPMILQIPATATYVCLDYTHKSVEQSSQNL